MHAGEASQCLELSRNILKLNLVVSKVYVRVTIRSKETLEFIHILEVLR